MTKAETEVIAREIRNKCLHSSWNDLVSFWQGVMGNLESAYLSIVQGTAATQHISSGHFSELEFKVKDELGMALSQLAGENQVARWQTEAIRRNHTRADGQGTDVIPDLSE